MTKKYITQIVLTLTLFCINKAAYTKNTPIDRSNLYIGITLMTEQTSLEEQVQCGIFTTISKINDDIKKIFTTNLDHDFSGAANIGYIIKQHLHLDIEAGINGVMKNKQINTNIKNIIQKDKIKKPTLGSLETPSNTLLYGMMSIYNIIPIPYLPQEIGAVWYKKPIPYIGAGAGIAHYGSLFIKSEEKKLPEPIAKILNNVNKKFPIFHLSFGTNFNLSNILVGGGYRFIYHATTNNSDAIFESGEINKKYYKKHILTISTKIIL